MYGFPTVYPSSEVLRFFNARVNVGIKHEPRLSIAIKVNTIKYRLVMCTVAE